jgi:SAM-dependent methyltransferase
VEPVEQTKNIEIINILNKYFLDKKTVVDVGCNIGLLLDFAKSRGLKTIGIELSEESKSILLSKGHEVYDSLDCVKDGSVDVITAFDLVEHLYNVNTFIESCYKKLSKNGVLIILTGNPSSLSATLSGKNWWYIKYPEHIVFPSKEYYKNLTNFNLCKYHQTYASKVYKVAFHKILLFFIKGFIKKMLFSFEYNGLPSLGPDHHLVVLKK